MSLGLVKNHEYILDTNNRIHVPWNFVIHSIGRCSCSHVTVSINSNHPWCDTKKNIWSHCVKEKDPSQSLLSWPGSRPCSNVGANPAAGFLRHVAKGTGLKTFTVDYSRSGFWERCSGFQTNSGSLTRTNTKWESGLIWILTVTQTQCLNI